MGERMRNYFKYPRLEWRKRHEYCKPRGPSFSGAQRIEIPIAGSYLRFRAPRHSPRDAIVEEVRCIRGRDVLEGQDVSGYGYRAMANDHWGCLLPFSRYWSFWGPWMTGCKAELIMSITVVGRREDHQFPNISYFNPRAFESVFATYLNDYYGHRRWDVDRVHPRYFGPADWRSHSHLSVFSGSCKIYRWAKGDVFLPGKDGEAGRILHLGKDVTQTAFPDRLFFFPITEKHFLLITFVQHLQSWDQQDADKPAFDISPVQELQDAIFNSIALELSPQAQASYDKIKAEHRNMQLSKQFAPLRWPTEAPTPGDTPPEKTAEVLAIPSTPYR